MKQDAVSACSDSAGLVGRRGWGVGDGRGGLGRGGGGLGGVVTTSAMCMGRVSQSVGKLVNWHSSADSLHVSQTEYTTGLHSMALGSGCTR